MKNSLHTSFLLILSSLLFYLPAHLNATQISGSEISWTCLGNDSFLVTIAIYRDCNGAGIPPVNLHVAPVNCHPDDSFSRALTFDGSADITPVCGNLLSRCADINSPFPHGIEELKYSAIIYLGNSSCCEWKLSWQSCCRSNNTTTAPLNQDFYIFSQFNSCVVPCNNSPVFRHKPAVIQCVGNCVYFNHGAFDPDGDSLVYSLVSPMTSENNHYTYTPPYTFELPLHFNGFPNADLPYNFPLCRGFHLNQETGELRFKPMQNQVTVMAIRVEKFRDGIKIAETRRDLQMIIDDCPGNESPYLSGINNPTSTTFYTEVWAGSQICFNIYSHDDDVDDSLSMSWNNAIPGATFTVTPVPRPVGTFCWTPTQNDASAIPHTFTVKVQDNACPTNTTHIRTYQVLVKSLSTTLVKFSNNNNITVFPNPFDKDIQVIIEPAVNDELVATIFDISGRKVRYQIVFSDEFIIPGSELLPGIYFLQITKKGEVVYKQKLVKF